LFSAEPTATDDQYRQTKQACSETHQTHSYAVLGLMPVFLLRTLLLIGYDSKPDAHKGRLSSNAALPSQFFCLVGAARRLVAPLNAPVRCAKERVVKKSVPPTSQKKINFLAFLFPTGVSQLTAKVLPFLAGAVVAHMTLQNRTALNAQHGKMAKL